jgi:HEAT repeat protein
VKLLDFGIAKIRAEQPVGESSVTGYETTELDEKKVLQLSESGSRPVMPMGSALLTSVGSVMGTPAYMAPEQVQNSSSVDKRADIYAIGIMLYEALACRRPFEAESSAELMGAHMYMKADPPSKQVQKHQVPDRQLDWAKLDPVVMRALAKKPEERYQDCAALQADLEAAWGQSFSVARGSAVGVGSSVTIAALPAPVVRPKSKAPLVAGLVAGLVLLGGGTAALLLRGGSQSVVQAQQAEASALLQRAQTGSPVDRRTLQEIIKAVGGRTHLPLVAKALTDEDPAVARAALQAVMALAQAGDASLSDPLQQLAGQAVGALSVEVAAAQLRIGESEAQGVLTSTLHSPMPTPEVRLLAAVLLADAGQLAAGALRQALQAALRAQLSQSSLRRDALVRLAKLGDGEALRQLAEATQQPATGPTKDAHLEALQVLTLAKQPGASDKLLKMAQSVVPAERVELGAVLAEVQDERVVSLLLPLMADASPKVRQRALAALGRMASQGRLPGYAETLIPLLKDTDSQVALTAAVSLLSARAVESGAAQAPGS